MNNASLAHAALCVFRRDLTVALRRVTDVFTPLVFFAIVVSLFPLGVGPEPAMLRALAPGVVWVAALLAAMLSLNRLFANDHADGTLEQLVLAPYPLTVLVLAKTAAHWVLTGLPLVLLSPLLALQLQLPAEAMGTLVVSLLLGTPVLSLLGKRRRGAHTGLARRRRAGFAAGIAVVYSRAHFRRQQRHRRRRGPEHRSAPFPVERLSGLGVEPGSLGHRRGLARVAGLMSPNHVFVGTKFRRFVRLVIYKRRMYKYASPEISTVSPASCCRGSRA